MKFRIYIGNNGKVLTGSGSCREVDSYIFSIFILCYLKMLKRNNTVKSHLSGNCGGRDSEVPDEWKFEIFGVCSYEIGKWGASALQYSHMAREGGNVGETRRHFRA